MSLHNENNRFSGMIGRDYDLFGIACPHYEKLQRIITDIIRNECRGLEKSRINVLEIGSGTGITTMAVMKADERIIITTVDNEITMIDALKRKLASHMHKNRLLSFHSDALPFLKKVPENSFDIFVSSFTLHNFEKGYRNDVLKEIYRILTLKGLFINADKYARNDKKAHYDNLKWQIGMFIRKFSEINRIDLIHEWTTHYIDDNMNNKIMKETESMETMKMIGFCNIKKLYREHMEAVITSTK